MFPASTHKGGAVLAFPDVCKTPFGAAGPVPVPYPNLGAGAAAMKPGSRIKPSTGDAAGTQKGMASVKQTGAATLRTQLNQLHATLMSMPGSGPNQWHSTLDRYVLLTAELYKTLASD